MVKLFWEMHVSPGFFLCAEAASTSSGCRWQKAPRSWRESAPTRWSRTAAGTKTNTSATNCGSDLTGPRLLRTSPCEGLFQGRLQSHTGAPPTSGPQPPAVLAWSSQPGCVRSGRLSWPSLSDPYTPQGTSSNTAPPAGSWNTAHRRIINQKHPPRIQTQWQTLYLLQVMRPFLWQAWHARNFRLMPIPVTNHCPSAAEWALKSMHHLSKAP